MLLSKFLENQKKMLFEEKSRLEKKIAELKKFPDYGQNEDDNAKETADFENNLSVESQLNLLLQKVIKAIESIDDKSYGNCLKCGKAIEEGRLEIMPYAELCINCRKSEKNS